MTHAQALRLIVERVDRIGTRALAARSWKITPAFLSMVLKEQRQIGPSLAKAVGLKATRYIVYRYESVGARG
jgi:hypothetical protein